MKIKQTLELLPRVHRSKVKANGRAPLFICITILGNLPKEIPVGDITPENWDVKSKWVLKAEPGYRELNNRITEISGELIGIYKKLRIQYGEDNVTPGMLKQTFESNSNQKSPSVLPVQHTLSEVPSFADPISGIPVLTAFSGSSHSLDGIVPNNWFPTAQKNPTLEMLTAFTAMQVQMNSLMQQMAALGIQTSPIAPVNPIAELQQNYNNLLVQFNRLTVSHEHASFVSQNIRPKASNFTLLDGFTEFITRFEKMVEKGTRSDGTLRQWRSTKRKIQKFLEDKYHAPDILYTEVMPDFGDVLYDYFTLEVDKPLDDATAKMHIKKTKQILKIGIKKTYYYSQPNC